MKYLFFKVGKVEKADVSFDNCIGRLIDIEAEQEVWETPLDFAQHAADRKVRGWLYMKIVKQPIAT